MLLVSIETILEFAELLRLALLGQASLTNTETRMDWTERYFWGVLSAALIILAIRRIFQGRSIKGINLRKQRSLYRSDHGILNFQLPPQSMWMNMGFWKVW